MRFNDHRNVLGIATISTSTQEVMDLINQLQSAAESEDVLSVLRKARRLAIKLQLKDATDWLDCEQRGYKTADTVPDYRNISTSFYLYAPVPVQYTYTHVVEGTIPLTGVGPFDIEFRPPISELLAVLPSLADPDRGYFVEAPPEANEDFRRRSSRSIPHAMRLVLKHDTAALLAIPDAIKDFVLEWACRLEASGVHGENMTFKPDEIEAAKTVNYFFLHSAVGQVNTNGSNSMSRGGE